ncbi:MAG: pseudouridine-5'-phosphate glycosidase [Ignavibacteria bacterium]|nr:pseudouridine-5'-phosphate glycosidase [Ignavibacteria bacterium]
MNNRLIISEEVTSAVNEGRPVVALESTIISHGMPYPENLETAVLLESIARSSNAVPATIAIIKGEIRVGLTIAEIEFLSRNGNILKASRRDLPVIIAGGKSAATTVSATMMCASMAGIRIFATGGIGGVHRNAQQTFDISADLTELGQTDVAVVSAGVKSILDIGLTLEYLETLGVPVIGYGTDEFPAFFTRESGFRVNYRLNTPQEVAEVIRAKQELGLKNGMLIAYPVPHEFSFDKRMIDEAIDEALKRAESEGIRGKDVTPYLLSQITKITKGGSLRSNIELVKNNVRLASEIACCV